MLRFSALALLIVPAMAVAQGVVPAKFNPASPDNSRVIPTFNYEHVEGVLDAIGAKHQRAGSASAPALRVTFPNNRRAVIAMSSCNSDGSQCKALSVQSYWTKIANSPADRVNAAIAGFNQKYSFAKAFVASDGRPALQRYLTADYGFVRGNLAVNMLVFANQADRFATDVLGPLERR